jgi:hypothetical protein
VAKVLWQATVIMKCWLCHYLQANKLVKEIQISMWGNIYVEELYEVVSALVCGDQPLSHKTAILQQSQISDQVSW